MKVYEKILNNVKNKKKSVAVLLDPDSEKKENLRKKIKKINESSIDYIFVGGSTLFDEDFESFLKIVKELSKIPVVIFPGSSLQVSKHCDAILFISLISGRNPQFLIGEHVQSAMKIKRLGIECIPTGYILIESGNLTSVEYISNTKPIPRDKQNIVISHALAGELLGFKLIYLDGGSGALYTIPDEIISKVKKEINVPLIVGGGIKSIEEIKKKHKSGADIVVIGNIIEKDEKIIDKINEEI